MKVFSSELALCIRWAKYWSFSFSISPSNEYSGLISFRMDWLDLLAVQGTLQSLLKHHSSKHQFFGAQLSLWSTSGVCAHQVTSCPTLCSPVDYSPPGSSVRGILQARILECVAISFSGRGSSQPRNGTPISFVSCIGRRVLYH